LNEFQVVLTSFHKNHLHLPMAATVILDSGGWRRRPVIDDAFTSFERHNMRDILSAFVLHVQKRVHDSNSSTHPSRDSRPGIVKMAVIFALSKSYEAIVSQRSHSLNFERDVDHFERAFRRRRNTMDKEWIYCRLLTNMKYTRFDHDQWTRHSTISQRNQRIWTVARFFDITRDRFQTAGTVTWTDWSCIVVMGPMLYKGRNFKEGLTVRNAEVVFKL
jgi:hypothetical protein